jgi:hypothetical protein
MEIVEGDVVETPVGETGLATRRFINAGLRVAFH